MRIDTPTSDQLPTLRQLWKTVFRDSDEFLDGFFATGFSPARCRCVTVEEGPVAALYWFTCACRGQKMAYLYAVATDPAHRGRGLCRALMENTRQHLAESGFQAVLLCPESDALAGMYEKMGYRFCTTVSKLACEAGSRPAALQRISREEYARLRREFLPDGGVVQEGENLLFLETMSRFYRGEGFLLSAREQEGELWGDELLGDASAAPGILKALHQPRGTFRIPGGDRNLLMWLPLAPDATAPGWFGLPFD